MPVDLRKCFLEKAMDVFYSGAGIFVVLHQAMMIRPVGRTFLNDLANCLEGRASMVDPSGYIALCLLERAVNAPGLGI